MIAFLFCLGCLFKGHFGIIYLLLLKLLLEKGMHVNYCFLLFQHLDLQCWR